MTNTDLPERPAHCTDDMLHFLDMLRESGLVNMFSGGHVLRQGFPDLSREQARGVLMYWMRTFGERKRREQRR